MSDLIQRLHAQAERRGVETARYDDSCAPGSKLTRHPLEIAHEVLAKLDMAGRSLEHSGGDQWWACLEYEAKSMTGTFIECVVALAEAEHE